MSRPVLVPHGRLSLSPMRLKVRSLAPQHLPGRAARDRAGDNSNVETESAIETACDLTGSGHHGAMGPIGATGALAVSDQLKLVNWASAKWGVT
jgi:hypothetical protein